MEDNFVETQKPLRLTRSGPTRPWQENLPQYQQQALVETQKQQGSTRVQNTPDQGQNSRTLLSKLPRESSERKILIFLVDLFASEKSQNALISRRQIVLECALSINTVKTSLHRLVSKELLKIVSRDYSCKAGGSRYFIPKLVAAALNSKQSQPGFK